MAVTDLRGTKWRITSTTCDAGYGQFSTEIILNDIPIMGSQGDIYIGYTFDMPGGLTPIANSVLIYTRLSELSSGDIIEFTGGSDLTNANLISWMQSHAEQIIEPTGNEYTLTQNLTNLTSGNITLTITPDEGYALPAQADIVVTGGTIVSYDDTTGELVVTAGTTAVEVTCESAVSTISFSINGTTYQAEDGMTWAQWCDSAYNTDGCYIANGGVYRANAIDSHLRSYSTNDNVLSTDTIVENGHYFWSSGGSND